MTSLLASSLLTPSTLGILRLIRTVLLLLSLQKIGKRREGKRLLVDSLCLAGAPRAGGAAVRCGCGGGRGVGTGWRVGGGVGRFTRGGVSVAARHCLENVLNRKPCSLGGFGVASGLMEERSKGAERYDFGGSIGVLSGMIGMMCWEDWCRIKLAVGNGGEGVAIVFFSLFVYGADCRY